MKRENTSNTCLSDEPADDLSKEHQTNDMKCNEIGCDKDSMRNDDDKNNEMSLKQLKFSSPCSLSEYDELVRNKLSKYLSIDLDQASENQEQFDKIQALTLKIVTDVRDYFKDDKEYKQKMIDIMFNIRKNTELRNNIINGNIRPYYLLYMDNVAMANEKLVIEGAMRAKKLPTNKVYNRKQTKTAVDAMYEQLQELDDCNDDDIISRCTYNPNDESEDEPSEFESEDGGDSDPERKRNELDDCDDSNDESGDDPIEFEHQDDEGSDPEKERNELDFVDRNYMVDMIIMKKHQINSARQNPDDRVDDLVNSWANGDYDHNMEIVINKMKLLNLFVE